jgi:maltose/moltooligosaccharide transporter
MGIFNMFIVLPEIIISLGLGWIMAHLLNNNRLLAVVLGGICLLIAAPLSLRVKEATPQPAVVATLQPVLGSDAVSK